MGLSLNMDEKNKNWRENKNGHRTLKAFSTKADTNLEEADDSKTVLSDLTFTVADAPYQVELHSASDTSTVPENTTIQGIFAAAGAWIQASTNTTTSDTYTITLLIRKYQVAILAKMGLLSLIKVENHIL